MLELLKGTQRVARDYILYPTIAFLPRGLQIKAFERLPNSWPKGMENSYQLMAHIDKGNAPLQELVLESLEERMGFEAAVRNTTRSAALEFVVGNAVFFGDFLYALVTGIATGDVPAHLNPYVVGAVWGASLYDAPLRYALSAGTPHQPAGLGQGITFFASFVANTLLSKENYREMWNAIRGK